MYCRALVCDLDGTGASNGVLLPEVAAALAAARAQGLVTVLATGRVFEEVQGLCLDLSVFDAIVAENGAIIVLPSRTIQIGQPPPRDFLGALQTRGIPFQIGAVVVGTWDRHAAEVLSLVRQFALDVQLVFNRAAMMLLPSGVTKGTGVQRALEEIGRSPHNAIAFGDAENDLPVFGMVGVAVAVRGSASAIATQADIHLSRPGGEGLARYIHTVLAQDGVVPTPARHHIVLGRSDDGIPAVLPALGTNVLITGDPRSGKSWFAGVVVEQLISRGLRFCLLDPEGGNLSLADGPGVLAVGSGLALPKPTLVPQLLRKMSVVLNLSSLSHSAQTEYVAALMPALEQCCRSTGLPHWIVIDEAQNFFPKPSPTLQRFGHSTNFAFITYRPSLIAPAVHEAVGAYLIMPTTVEEERYFISALFQARGPRDLIAADAVRGIRHGQVGLLTNATDQPRWQVFTPAPRRTRHTHHARKYVDQHLPSEKAFHFLVDGSVLVARNVLEFRDAVDRVPMSTLRHHLSCGDFSRWVAEVLGDEVLANGLRKLEIVARSGATINRAEIVAYLVDHYQIDSTGAREIRSSATSPI